MKEPNELDELAEKFFNGKCDERYYVSRHQERQKNGWQEINEYYANPVKWGKFLERFFEPENRRKALLEASMPKNVNQLKKITGWTTQANQLAKTSLQIKDFEPSDSDKALFGIIKRVSFLTAKGKFMIPKISMTCFELLEDPFIDVSKFRAWLEGIEKRDWVTGKIVQCNEKESINNDALYLRIERRLKKEDQLLIIDLWNYNPVNGLKLNRILQKMDMSWSCFTYPTIDPNHFFKIYVNTHSEKLLNELIKEEFIWITNKDILKLQ